MDIVADNPLLAEDLTRLEEQGHEIEVLHEGPLVGVVIRDYRLPTGLFNHETTSVLLQTTDQYPLSAMDMFWVDPDLTFADGRVPGGSESVEVHFGRSWRRFSWHRNSPWVPGRDDLVGHFEFCVARLERNE